MYVCECKYIYVCMYGININVGASGRNMNEKLFTALSRSFHFFKRKLEGNKKRKENKIKGKKKIGRAPSCSRRQVQEFKWKKKKGKIN